eukprot:CAMPEP_0177761694 /NCGR_PEP_ID=MMETSP0491_2-20121128/5944_1 /TAXON_ID=63592 /ORGANISM="Tetraselmis chuii, Strain PLY429" /LENGTH=105 /DNA_ID=CAMNT_0019277691 /DNA_START=318 /DNA_END=638 /DNA_ORIENTATION=+
MFINLAQCALLLLGGGAAEGGGAAGLAGASVGASVGAGVGAGARVAARRCPRGRRVHAPHPPRALRPTRRAGLVVLRSAEPRRKQNHQRHRPTFIATFKKENQSI